MPPNFHLLGDKAYPLLSYLLVPFRNLGRMGEVELRFNKHHSSTRVEVERAIGLLKGKWRKLKHLEKTVKSDMLNVIGAACVLHNFVIRAQGIDLDDIEALGEEEEAVNHNENENQAAHDKRMEIAHLLY